MPTPIEALDQAIRDYIAAIADEEPGELAAWVIAWSEQRLVLQDGIMPLQTSRDWMLGPATTIEAATGLIRYAQLDADNHLIGYDEAD